MYVWRILFIITAGAILWFSAKFSFEIYRYARIDSLTRTESIDWAVREIGDSKFALMATFVYKVGESVFEKSLVLESPIYPNEYLASDAIRSRGSSPWRVYYNGKNPAISDLQRNFPFLTMVQLILALGVLVYFIWLREYTTQYNRAS